MRKLILAATMNSILTSPVYAEVYKCIDQEGKVNYQETPCNNRSQGKAMNLNIPSKRTWFDETEDNRKKEKKKE